jgi:hypothetical protein
MKMDSAERAPSEISGVRVRYSRLGKEDRTPKNTLVTVKNGDTVFFGISRCNRKLDTFHKNIGTYIAHQRAQLAHDDSSQNDYKTYVPESNADFQLHRSGLRGSVSLENVKEVVKFFRIVDEHCLNSVSRPRTVGV